MIEPNQIYVGVTKDYLNSELRVLRDNSTGGRFTSPDTFVVEYVKEELPFVMEGHSIRTNFVAKAK